MIKISKKADIIIPFEKIGNDKWHIKTKDILQEFADNWDEELKEPKSNEEIIALENYLGVELPKSLRAFYSVFGVANIGDVLLDFDEIDYISNICGWFENPQYAPDFTENEKSLIPNLIAFSDGSGSGNMLCFHKETKEIYYYDHDTKPYFSKFFEDASDYIKCCLIFCQSEFFDEKIGIDTVEDWCDEVLNKLFGENIIDKWLY